MEYFYLVFAVSVVFATKREHTVTVSDDVYVRATPSPLYDPQDAVKVTFNCTGSGKGLQYYIANSVKWSFTSTLTGEYRQLTDSFYFTKLEKAIADKYAIAYRATSSEAFQFSITVKNVDFSDDGIYTCGLYDTAANSTLDIKHVRLTVVEDPVFTNMTLSGSGVMQEVSSKDSGEGKNLTLVAGHYEVQCCSPGGNPAAHISILYRGQAGHFAATNALPDDSVFCRAESVNVRYTEGRQAVSCTSRIQHGNVTFFQETVAIEFDVQSSAKLEKPALLVCLFVVFVLVY